MKSAHDIIIRPVITEKSMQGIEQRKYTFRVAEGVNKIEIAKAVEGAFGVKVAKVHKISVRGQQRRNGKHVGYTPSWTKAIVTLTEDSKKIEFFEGMM